MSSIRFLTNVTIIIFDNDFDFKRRESKHLYNFVSSKYIMINDNNIFFDLNHFYIFSSRFERTFNETIIF